MAFISAVVAAMVLAGPVLALVGAEPQPGELVLVVGAGGAALDRIILAAGGAPVGPNQSWLGGFAMSPSPAFADALRDEGAWFVLDARRLAAICGDPS